MMAMWLNSLYRYWQLKQLKQPEYAFLFEPPTRAGVVSLDCETTGLDPKKDEIISIGAVRIVDNQILTSERLELKLKPEKRISADAIKVHQLRNCDVEDGLEPIDAMNQLLDFVGSSPILGYYLEFDMALINRLVQPWLGIRLPNQQLELSALYYDQKIGLIPQKRLDLRLNSICTELKVPNLGTHDAYTDALTVAIAYVKLKQSDNTLP